VDRRQSGGPYGNFDSGPPDGDCHIHADSDTDIHAGPTDRYRHPGTADSYRDGDRHADGVSHAHGNSDSRFGPARWGSGREDDDQQDNLEGDRDRDDPQRISRRGNRSEGIR
jgi:hypothetical protein